jgi:hypothetical protein
MRDYIARNNQLERSQRTRRIHILKRIIPTSMLCLKRLNQFFGKMALVLLQPIKDDVVMTQIVDIETGEMVESWMRLPMITDPQKILSAITYFRRGTLQSMLALQSIDDDGQTAAAAPKSKPGITTERFEKAMVAISKKEFTVEQLKSTYLLTDLQLKAIEL